MNTRDPQKEKKILKYNNMSAAFMYAKNIINGRWPEAEKFIKQDPFFALNYARDVIKGRWPEAEEYIKKSAEYAYYYAKNVIKGRWPEAEEFIKKDEFWSVRYAKYVIKRRWPEAESIIRRGTREWDDYLYSICKQCEGNGVVDIGFGGAEEECQQCQGSGFDPDKI